MKHDGFEDIATRLAEVCGQETAIVAAYIFGSRARGTTHPSSDLDVAILVDEDRLNEFPLLSFAATLEKVVRGNVDVVVLNRGGELLKHQVRRSGILVFERNPHRRKQFEVLGRKKFEDFMYLHRRYTAAVLYRSTHGR